VLCDHTHAVVDARTALLALQVHHPTAPLILISAAVDESVVTSVRAGAEDIVLKRNLSHLSRLKLSAKTVESHRGEVMKRLGMAVTCSAG
jgi:DNA-binding NarL/FixJ family response regulator